MINCDYPYCGDRETPAIHLYYMNFMDQPDIIARCGFHELILPKGISFKKISEDEYIMIKILIQ